jgi:hypothetical protein
MNAMVSKSMSMRDFPMSVSRFHVAMFSSSKPQFHFDRQPTSTLGDRTDFTPSRERCWSKSA